MIKLSCIVPVLNSHEIVRRQMLWFKRMDLPDTVEILYVDDGSDPPIQVEPEDAPRNFRIIVTNDFRPWTWALARNTGAKQAQGIYFLMTDLDYILSKDAILRSLEFTGDRLAFHREFGVLDEDGNFTQDIPTLLRYGLLPERVPTRGVKMPPHPNNFCMKREVYWMLGGYREDCIGRPYPQGEDRWFKKVWLQAVKTGTATECEMDTRPTIYMFPNGAWCGNCDYNPKDQNGNPLFHDLSRKSDLNASIYAKRGEGVGYDRER